MTDLDQMVSKLGDDASYGDDAADRLARRLAAEPAPSMLARGRRRAMALAFAVAAMVGGGMVGAVGEATRPPPAVALLPASADGAAASLLFGDS